MKNIIVIDNFYEKPESVRNYALTKARYLSKNQLNPLFPGTESVHSFTSAAVIKKIEFAVGQKIVVDPAKFSFGVFSKTDQSDQENKAVHLDASEWTGIVYLNSPKECSGGTCFYEHKKTGLTCVPSENQLHAMGFHNMDDFKEMVFRQDARNENAWKVSVKVGMKFNRLVLFKASELFHAAENYFGSSDNGFRLTQLFFFSTAEAT